MPWCRMFALVLKQSDPESHIVQQVRVLHSIEAVVHDMLLHVAATKSRDPS